MKKRVLITGVGDNSKFVRMTSWKSQISIECTLQDLLNYWRKQLKTARM